MDVQEYLKLSKEFDKQNSSISQIELTHFVTVWMKSRLPETYKELESSFQDKESQIYAHRECQSHNNEIDF